MALDGIYLSLLRKEFDPLIDGRVDKIHQPSREELIMTIRTKGCAEAYVQHRCRLGKGPYNNGGYRKSENTAYVLYAHEKASCRGQTHCH